MPAQLAIDFEAPAAKRSRALRTAIVVALGRIAVVVADGDAGRRDLVLPARNAPPGTDPCPRCEHRARCVLLVGVGSDGRPDAEGCPTATDWRAAEAAYAGAP